MIPDSFSRCLSFSFTVLHILTISALSFCLHRSFASDLTLTLSPGRARSPHPGVPCSSLAPPTMRGCPGCICNSTRCDPLCTSVWQICPAWVSFACLWTSDLPFLFPATLILQRRQAPSSVSLRAAAPAEKADDVYGRSLGNSVIPQREKCLLNKLVNFAPR